MNSEMSKNREHAVWRSPDGTWNIGFFRCEVQHWLDDPDPEWDVDYDYGEFSWLSRGHLSSDDAVAAWKGANPGHVTIIGTGEAEEISRLEDVASRYVP